MVHHYEFIYWETQVQHRWKDTDSNEYSVPCLPASKITEAPITHIFYNYPFNICTCPMFSHLQLPHLSPLTQKFSLIKEQTEPLTIRDSVTILSYEDPQRISEPFIWKYRCESHRSLVKWSTAITFSPLIPRILLARNLMNCFHSALFRSKWNCTIRSSRP